MLYLEEMWYTAMAVPRELSLLLKNVEGLIVCTGKTSIFKIRNIIVNPVNEICKI